MTSTIRTGNGASGWLKANGFTPASACTRKVAGVVREWIAQDGRSATVSYGLYSRTSQSSRGSSAVWGYTVTIEDARLAA